MLHAYQYFTHPYGALHGAMRRFLWRLRRSNRATTGGELPADFVIADWCDGCLNCAAGTALHTLLGNFYQSYRLLNRAQAKQFYRAFRNINRIEDQVAGKLPLVAVPEPIAETAKKLFLHLFKTTDHGAHYSVFWRRHENHQCPFCGLELLIAPEDQTQDYDHQLLKADYPLAAVNPRNLAPMCERCNRTYKGTKDLIVSAGGARRRAFYAYKPHGLTITVSLAGSQRPKAGRPGAWSVELLPDCEEIGTWEAVFEIKHRFAKYGLDEYYQHWLRQFVNWASNQNHGQAWTSAAVRTELKRHAEWLSTEAEYGSQLVRSSLFSFLHDANDAAHLQILADQLETRRTKAGLS